jgi:flagellar L-ring protein precursor FlgH
VIDVLPNKNLVIEGTRQTSFGGEVQDVILRGVLRAEDVSANNTAYSYNIADSTVRIVSRGSISDTSKKGWVTRALDKVNPF